MNNNNNNKNNNNNNNNNNNRPRDSIFSVTPPKNDGENAEKSEPGILRGNFQNVTAGVTENWRHLGNSDLVLVKPSTDGKKLAEDVHKWVEWREIDRPSSSSSSSSSLSLIRFCGCLIATLWGLGSIVFIVA